MEGYEARESERTIEVLSIVTSQLEMTIEKNRILSAKVEIMDKILDAVNAGRNKTSIGTASLCPAYMGKRHLEYLKKEYEKNMRDVTESYPAVKEDYDPRN